MRGKSVARYLALRVPVATGHVHHPLAADRSWCAKAAEQSAGDV